jgi:L-ascorbate metabolism protein UlaG (beta-lactamase superfamily)
MGEVHCSPADAVEAHRILAPRLTVASHFGSFPLADDGFAEPLEQLTAALQSSEPDVAARFIAISEGDGRMVD